MLYSDRRIDWETLGCDLDKDLALMDKVNQN